MFERKIQVGLVKENKKAMSSKEESIPTFQVYTANAVVVLQTLGENATKMMVTYMFADTIRKIAVSRLSK